MRTRIFYGWYVALACGLGLACGLASVITATFSIFLGPLRAEFGWTPSETFTGLLLVTAAVTVAAPFVGSLVDRFGAKRMILAGFLLEGLVIASFATQTASLATFYARYIALAILGLGTTHVAFARVISVWFDRRRGLALGLALAGLGLGGIAWPLLSQWAITNWGWRVAYLVVAFAVAAVGMLSIGLVVRESPAVMGLRPDGDEVPAGKAAATAVPPGFTLAETMRQPHFWLMLAAFLLIGVAVQSLILHLVPLLVLRGVEPMRAAQAQSLVAAALIVGRVAAGMLMDRFFAPRVAIAFLVGPVVGLILLASGASGTAALLAGMLTGLAAGAEVDVTAYLASRYFGLRYFSRTYAWFYSAYSAGAGLGPLITARAVETSGDYTGILYVHAALLVVAALMLARLKPFPNWGQAPISG
ncbi:MAG: MFS transporter [Gammaproteobacteria bacterium]|jgi:MFS family permease|nr:MFS transporter [Gammaproteobacteria bacterium]